MIKLTILSGIILNHSIDSFNRSALHYATWLEVKHNNLFEVLLKCYSMQLGNKQDDLVKYISKAFKNEESSDNVLTDGEVSFMMEEMNVKKSNVDNANSNKVKKLHSLKDALNLKDIDGRTILHYACINNNLEIINMILNYNASPEEKDFENNVSQINLS